MFGGSQWSTESYYHLLTSNSARISLQIISVKTTESEWEQENDLKDVETDVF